MSAAEAATVCVACYDMCITFLPVSFFFFFPLHSVKLWASAFGGEIKSIAAKYSGSQLLQKVRISLVVIRKDFKKKMDAAFFFFFFPHRKAEQCILWYKIYFCI